MISSLGVAKGRSRERRRKRRRLPRTCTRRCRRTRTRNSQRRVNDCAAQTECEELRESLDAHGVRISSLEKDLKTTRNSLTAAKEENKSSRRRRHLEKNLPSAL